MSKITIEDIILNYLKDGNEILEKINKFYLLLLNKILKLDAINNYLEQYKELKNYDFIDAVLDMTKTSYSLPYKYKIKIPSEGKLIIVANHPLGGLDGLAALKAISEVRKDVKVVANEILTELENIKDLILPANVFNRNFHNNRTVLKGIEKSLQNEEAIIIFPAAEVSRFNGYNIRDRKWSKGAIKLSRKFNSPVLPMFIEARNSMVFYLLSLINKNISTFLLPRELLKAKVENINIKIGDPIPATAFDLKLTDKIVTNLLYKHVHNLKKSKPAVFITEKTIIHPLPNKLMRQELTNSDILKITPDNQILYLSRYKNSPNIIKEIGRLREITFRKVGEGTGKEIDNDEYDKYYDHLILWNDYEMEIAGSYRLVDCKEIIEKCGVEKLYNCGQFIFDNEMIGFLNQSVELGRSFIQQKYWRSRALDYLWQGIGAYLYKKEHVRYLIGAVSISNSYPEPAKALIVEFYRKWYQKKKSLAEAKNKYYFSKNIKVELDKVLCNYSREEDFGAMIQYLKSLNINLPVLLKKYTDLCYPEGVTVIDFGVDSTFSDSIDVLLMLDLTFIKEEYQKRYYKSSDFDLELNFKI